MFEFVVDIVVESVQYKSGDRIQAGDVPPGSLTELKRLSYVRAVQPPPPSPPMEVMPPSAKSQEKKK